MREPNDKLLHEWVRQTLDAHQPNYDPAGWEHLRPRLRRRRFRPWLLLALLVLLIGGLGIWFGQDAAPNRTAITASPLRVPKNDASPTDKTTDFPEPVRQKAVSPSRGPQTEALSRNAGPAAEFAPFVVFDETYVESRPILPPADWWQKPAVLPIRVAPVPEILIQEQMLKSLVGTDSTTYRVLTRNRQKWPNAVVVCDFTTSMTPYSTQLYAWLKRNAQHSAIKGTVLFTDCDSLGRETRPGGPAGQLFVTTEPDPARALPTFLAAYRNTLRNANEAENDVEALLFAQKRFPNADHLILIADIDNPVKDLALLDQVTKPVHVILCGRDWDSTQAFHPDFYTIARRTNGSLHTLEDDLDPSRLQPDTWVRIDNRYYRYHRGKDQFVLTRFRHRPKRLMGFFWR
ncbi:hypothetical protein ACFQ4C_24470 [Larkinella insperata]|uniref:VWA domain-containing protein n=1 Tax=Larkinella insperata TaxID=332158 RepID=A0ABW3QD52_9BACT|nr:hypothetical protein [Larkinella insperata]